MDKIFKIAVIVGSLALCVLAANALWGWYVASRHEACNESMESLTPGASQLEHRWSWAEGCEFNAGNGNWLHVQ